VEVEVEVEEAVVETGVDHANNRGHQREKK
jgi:hypothetical protein